MCVCVWLVRVFDHRSVVNGARTPHRIETVRVNIYIYIYNANCAAAGDSPPPPRRRSETLNRQFKIVKLVKTDIIVRGTDAHLRGLGFPTMCNVLDGRVTPVVDDDEITRVKSNGPSEFPTTVQHTRCARCPI